MLKCPERVSVKKKEDIPDLPNLIEIQIKSYKQFLQIGKLARRKRKYRFRRGFQGNFSH
uniref:Uncharacterized protein n=1 Tax=Chlamydia pneumoniae TaxID=83558 RepID=A0A0F7WZL0_CHLPN|nr:hypothetical protein BN1224_MUL2216_C_00150 [Chlamydia pneumoniae]